MRHFGSRLSHWSFARQALFLSGGLVLAMYFPCALGKVPLPADLLGYFPPWHGLPGVAPPTRHGELGDLLTLMYPWRIVLSESLRHGELPFWNPHSYVGAPFLADPVSAVFYPPHLLFAVLPVWLAWSLQFPLRLALAVFFAALLARRIGASRLGALLSGGVYGLCGYMTGWQGWPQADVMVWTPLGFFAVLELRRRPGPVSAALLAVPLAITALAGHPEVSLYAVCAIVAFALWNLGEASRRGRGARRAVRSLVWLAVSGVFALGICAAQLVPTAEWLPRITRGLDFDWPHRPARDWISLVSRDTQTNPTAAGLQFPEEACYAGMATLLLAPLAFLRKRKGTPAFFAILGFCAFAAAFGWSPISEVFRAVPIFRPMPGTRLTGIADLCLAMLAGLGFTEVERLRGAPRTRLAFVGLILAAGATAAAIWILRDRGSGYWIADPLRRPRFVFLLLSATFVTLLGALASRRRRSRWLVACLILAAVDLGTFAWRRVPWVPRDAVFPPGPVTDFLQTHVSKGDRVVFLDRTAFRNVEIAYGLDALDGYPQVLRQTAALLVPLNGGTDHDEPLLQLTTEGVLGGERSRHVLDVAGARFLVVNIYATTPENLERLGRLFPLTYSAGGVRIFENPAARPLVSSPDGACTVEGIERRGNTVSAAVTCVRPATLAIAVTFYPGWRADVSGTTVTVEATKDGLSALAAPAGRSVVRLRFRPTRFALAAAISGTSLVAAVGVLVAGRRRLRWPRLSGGRASRRPGPSPPRRRARSARRGESTLPRSGAAPARK